ncbi:MAG: alpha-ketoacid dehydrogenase subunit alpha/beta [Bacteroidia bacterium]
MPTKTQPTSFVQKEEVLHDYRIAFRSRQASLLGRKEVLRGKAKFGIFGDGKEVPQIAWAKAFKPGDIRSGYYRDQTLLFALGILTVEEFFAQLYADPDIVREPASGGRQMNNHFATPAIDAQGQWYDLTEKPYIVSDVSPTASQMPRLVGLAWASKLYRELPSLQSFSTFSRRGNEIAWGSIGDASTSEGLFWESLNALAVLQVPAVISVWDDGYGISVPVEYQTVKGSISEAVAGFVRTTDKPGILLYTVRGWDYEELLRVYQQAAQEARMHHTPVLIHVIELTQPQGHSTSGSHERYKSPERLAWEKAHDCLVKMRQWLLEKDFATEQEIEVLEAQEKEYVENAMHRAWEAYQKPLREQAHHLIQLLTPLKDRHPDIPKTLQTLQNPRTILLRRDLLAMTHRILRNLPHPQAQPLAQWYQTYYAQSQELYSSHLHRGSALQVTHVPPIYSEDAPLVEGFKILNACFRSALTRDPRVFIFGEDVGELGDVNQGCAGLQKEFGKARVSDTGIREATIVGQAIGLALRGLRPIAEIQYLDYLLYALQILSDEVATLHWRTVGRQKAPLIIRTRGHRLEGIWHSGSPMGGFLHLVRGMYVLVPRDMTQAAGMYNTLLAADEPALLIEVLNGYRLKERLPDNIGSFTVPLGVPEILRQGEDVTLVTYGATCRIVLEAAENLASLGISAEVIDVQSLLPFDLPGSIGQSLKKTGRIAFIDEDVPGGASAYMMQQVLEKQKGYFYLDEPPVTITGKPHRPAYGSDGDYFSKPNVEEIVDRIYGLVRQGEPHRYPILWASGD